MFETDTQAARGEANLAIAQTKQHASFSSTGRQHSPHARSRQNTKNSIRAERYKSFFCAEYLMFETDTEVARGETNPPLDSTDEAARLFLFDWTPAFTS
jgi:hypothetical protein